MATIPHVEYGSVARSAHQNSLIDQLNTNTGGLATQNDRITSNTGDITTNSGDIADLQGRVTDLETPPLVPRCVLRKSTDQLIPTNVDTVVTWDVAESGNNSMYQGDTIVVPEDGEYLIAGQVNIAEGGTEPGECILYIADVTTPDTIDVTAIAAFGQSGVPAGSPGGLGNGLSTSTVRQMAAGTVLNVQVFQSSGSDRYARAQAFGGCTFTVSKQSERT